MFRLASRKLYPGRPAQRPVANRNDSMNHQLPGALALVLAFGVAGTAATGGSLQLRSQLGPGALGSSGASDCWGYVAPSGREYAIICTTNGNAFVEVTDPDNPVVVSIQPGPVTGTRDVKTYADRAYSVGEGGGGIQVFDLSLIDSGVVSFVGNVTTGGGLTTHNVAIDEESGFLYRCRGGSTGLRIYDLNQSLDDPPFVGSWSVKTVHDAQVVTYTSGPLAGRQIAYCSTGFAADLTIVDVTDKSQPVALSSITWPQNAHGHQGWLDEQRRYFYLNDESDESFFNLPTTTHVFDVSDPSNPSYAGSFTNGNNAVGHNGFVKGDLLYEANYTSGLRVFDLSVDPVNPPEIDFYDTYPGGDPTQFVGLWGVYPFFPSGTVIGSDTQRGLFVWSTSAARNYCTAGVSASGCQASLQSSGTPSATAATGFSLVATNVEGGKDGLYFFGTNGRQANPWGSGTSFQCVVPPVARAGLLSGTGPNGSCAGGFAQDLNALWASKPVKNPGSGAVVQAQLWYRDPDNTSNQTTSLSDALEFTVQP